MGNFFGGGPNDGANHRTGLRPALLKTPATPALAISFKRPEVIAMSFRNEFISASDWTLTSREYLEILREKFPCDPGQTWTEAELQQLAVNEALPLHVREALSVLGADDPESSTWYISEGGCQLTIMKTYPDGNEVCVDISLKSKVPEAAAIA